MRKWFKKSPVKRAPEYRLPGPVARLTDEERAELQQMIQSPVFRRAMALIHTKRPPLVDRLSPEEANQRYHELLGWAQYETALVNVWREQRKESALVEKFQPPEI